MDEEQADLELAHLIINPTMRNNGIGKILIKLLEEEAKLFHYPTIYMRVNPQNEQAINCYLKCNYILDQALIEHFENKWTWLKKIQKTN
ncbi:MAG TPA: GNAT family N-acetyltransferase [Pseudoneobacillus sp.]|nr:GNAT family N-acetyltransferase [Pseudoneobacillus sp.]